MPVSARLIVIKCVDCNHHASGLSEQAAMAALTDHRHWEATKPVEVCQ